MSRHNLTDSEWNAIRGFLPAERSGRPGRPWVSHRKVINGILWVLRDGGSWRDLPAEFGKWKTVYNRFRRWVAEGLWDRIVKRLLKRLDTAGKIDRSLWCVDSSVIRAHRVASGARLNDRAPSENAKKNGLGRSRGGYSTKIHVVTDARGIPLAVTVTGGQCNEAPEFERLLDSVPLGLHRKHKRPKRLAGDKAYSSLAIRNYLTNYGIADVIPKRSDQKHQVRLNRREYRRRNIVERTIGKLKEFRRIATRYEKLAETYLAMIQIASFRITLKMI